MNIEPKPPALLARILEHSEAIGFTMPSEAGTGSLLRMLAASKPGGRFLEIGTGTGLATAWLLDGMDRASSLVSIDIDPKFQSVAREILGGDKRVTFIAEDAGLVLRRQEPLSFDLIFADAMVGKYELLDETLALLKTGGLFVVDDMLPQANWPENHGPRVEALFRILEGRKDLISARFDWASGIVVSTKRA